MENNRKFYFEKQKPGDMAKRVPTLSTRFALWKYLFADKMTNVIKLNIASVVCFLPVLVVVGCILFFLTGLSSTLPFNSFLGVGYPTVIDASAKAFSETQEVFRIYGLYYMPLALLVSLVLSTSVQYAARNMVWTEGDFRFKTLFKGFKFNLQLIPLSFITSLLYLGYAYCIYLLRENIYVNGTGFGSVVGIIALVIVGLFLLVCLMYAYSISLTYKENLLKVLADSVLLTVKLIPTNLVFSLATVLPVGMLLLFRGGLLGSIVLVACIFVGFSYMLLTWTVYSQYVFDLATGKMNDLKPYGKK